MREICIAAALFALLLAVTACERSDKPIDAEAEQAQQPATTKPTDAYARFVEARNAVPRDFNALSGIYQNDLAPYVAAVDNRYGTNLDSEIRSALVAGGAGQNPSGSVQAAEKLIQYAFLLTFRNSLHSLAAAPPRNDLFGMIKEASPVIRATVSRRSTWIGKGEQLADTFDAILKKAEEAAAQGDATAIEQASSEMDALLAKTYALSVFYELDGLAKARGQDAGEAEEKSAEARIFHRCILEEHATRNPDGARSVSEQLAKPAVEIDVDLVRDVLRIDFAAEIADVDPGLLGR